MLIFRFQPWFVSSDLLCGLVFVSSGVVFRGSDEESGYENVFIGLFREILDMGTEPAHHSNDNEK